MDKTTCFECGKITEIMVCDVYVDKEKETMKSKVRSDERKKIFDVIVDCTRKLKKTGELSNSDCADIYELKGGDYMMGVALGNKLVALLKIGMKEVSR